LLPSRQKHDVAGFTNLHEVPPETLGESALGVIVSIGRVGVEADGQVMLMRRADNVPMMPQRLGGVLERVEVPTRVVSHRAAQIQIHYEFPPNWSGFTGGRDVCLFLMASSRPVAPLPPTMIGPRHAQGM